MRCVFCPRTARLPRVLKTTDKELVRDIVSQLRPHDLEDIKEWEKFCGWEYKIWPNSLPSENHFFLHVIPYVIQLHLYGDPLLDKNIASHVVVLRERGLKSYFSCNPANIDIERVERCFDSGLDYIKFSIESTNDERHKELRGEKSNFEKSYHDICKLLEIKKKNNYQTTVVITMLNLGNESQQSEYESLLQAFDGKDVYIYLKSEDTMWYRQQFHQTQSIHWSEFCRQPWMCMAIDPFGNAVECMESNSSEIVLGNTKKESLFEIWNGEKYRQFRRDHVWLNREIRCYKECDMKMAGSFIND